MGRRGAVASVRRASVAQHIDAPGGQLSVSHRLQVRGRLQ
jgi:hypothetical protein